METRNKIKLVSLNIVGTYDYNTTNDECPLCKNPLTHHCQSCEQKNILSEKCHKSVGLCTHAMHLHCIEKWLPTNENCPICMTPFEYDVKRLDNPEWRQVNQQKKKKSESKQTIKKLIKQPTKKIIKQTKKIIKQTKKSSKKKVKHPKKGSNKFKYSSKIFEQDGMKYNYSFKTDGVKPNGFYSSKYADVKTP